MADPQTTDDFASQWLSRPSKPVTTNVDKPAPAEKAPAKSDDLASQWLSRSGGSVAPEKPKEQPLPPGAPKANKTGFLTTSVFKLAGGKSTSEMYENSSLRKAIEGIVPESANHEDPQSYVSRFLAESYHAMPESLDFITSPAGLGLIALHTTPYTRAIAPAVDYGFAMYAGKQAMDALSEFRKDKSPENLAHVAVALAGAYMGVKAAGVGKALDAPRASGRFISGVAERAAKEVKRDELQAKLKDAAPYTEEGEKAPNKTQVLEAKVKLLDEIAAPKTFWDKYVKKATTLPMGVGDAARILRVPMPQLMEVSSDLVRDRAVFEAENKARVNLDLHAIERSTPAEDLTIYKVAEDGKIQPSNKIAAVIQGTVSPEEAGLSPEGKNAVTLLRKMNHDSVKLIKDFYGDDASVIDPDEYISQMWEMPDKGQSPPSRAARTLMRDRFMKQRTFEDYQTGIEAGWKPKFNNVTEVVRARWDYLIRSIANQRLANTMNDLGAVATRSQKETLHLNDWVEMTETPALNRAAYQETTKSTKMKGRGANKHEVEVEKAFYRYDPVYVHPHFAPAAQAVFAKRWSPPAMATLENIRSFGKRLNLMGSLFHNWAISEQSQALTASQEGAVSGLKKWWFTEPEVYKGAYTGIVEVIGKGKPSELPVFRVNQDLLTDGIRHGLKLEVADAERSTQSALRNFGRDDPGWKHAVTAPLRAMGHMEHILNRSLWDFYLPSQMAHSYELGVDSAIKALGEDARPEQIRAAKRAIADQINDAYGAISWEKMLVHPKTAQVMNWVFLAPGWKVSNLRVFSQFLEGPLGRQMSLNYLRGAAITWFVSAQVGNYLSSAIFKNKDKDGNVRPHFTWDNPGTPSPIPGAGSNFGAIAAGYNPNGSERYINWGKGLLDPIHAATDPVAWFSNARSGPLQALGNAFFGVDPVTGYRYVDPYGTTTEQNIQRIETMLPVFVPFSLRDPIRAIDDKRFAQLYPMPGGATMLFQSFGFPTRQGLNYTKAKSAYISAMKEGDHQAAMIVLKVAQMNQLSPRAIDQEWRKYQASERKKNAPLQKVYGVTGEVQ